MIKASYHRLLAYTMTQGMPLGPVFYEEIPLDLLAATGYDHDIAKKFIRVLGGE